MGRRFDVQFLTNEGARRGRTLRKTEHVFVVSDRHFLVVAYLFYFAVILSMDEGLQAM